MTYWAFLTAILALLLAPGPTNTLMGIAGTRQGLRSVLTLVPAELLGYLTAILPMAWLGHALLGQSSIALIVLKAVAACWILYLAFGLWKNETSEAGNSDVTARRIYVTTMLNPKALIFALVLLPCPFHPDFVPKILLFCLSAAIVALLWAGLGSLTRIGNSGDRMLLWIRRAASIWLAIISGTIAATFLPV